MNALPIAVDSSIRMASHDPFGAHVRDAHRTSILVLLLTAALIPGAASRGATGVSDSSVRPVALTMRSSSRDQPSAAPTSGVPDSAIRPGSRSANALAAPPRHVLFGAWVKPVGSKDRLQALRAQEAKIGRTYGVFRYYHGWESPLIGDLGNTASRGGRALMVSWKAAHEWPNGGSSGRGAGYVRWGDIASGRQDAVIAARAQELKRFGKTVYLSFHHEPENDRDIPGDRRAGSPAEFRAAWQHIWRMFQARGVHNVRFVLVLMGQTYAAGNEMTWYPGDRFVDVVAADGYNWFRTTNHPAAPWRSFATIFTPGYRFALRHAKPFWVAETGLQEDPSRPGRKAEWLKAMAAQAERWTDLGAVMYFMGGANGWWVDSSASSMAAYRSVAHARIFLPAPKR